MNARGLQLIPLSGDRIVFKRGVGELLVTGPGIRGMAETLLPLLDGVKTREEILEAFPGPIRPQIDRLLRALSDRQLLAHSGPGAGELDGDVLQSSFYANFGSTGTGARRALKTSNVVIFGVNLIARSLTRSLLEMGLGNLTLVNTPVLNDEFASADWLHDLKTGMEEPERTILTDGTVPDDIVENAALVCATSDLGEPDALNDLNRVALRNGKLFLPAWIGDLIGHVGPLVHPFETACFRCYRLRIDSNDQRYDIALEVRKYTTTNSIGRASSGLLPPMAAIVGEIAAMEVVKCLTAFAPIDSVGRIIDINLISFASTIRRVLKIPRCPECSDVMLRPGVVLTQGPQIPFRK